MEKISPTTRMMLATETILDEQAKKTSGSPVRLPNVHGGPKQPVILGSSAIQKVKDQGKDSAQIPMKTMYAILNKSDHSKNGIIKMAKDIRAELGRKAIEPGLKEGLIERPKRVRKFFKVQKFKVWTRNKAELYLDHSNPSCNK